MVHHPEQREGRWLDLQLGGLEERRSLGISAALAVSSVFDKVAVLNIMNYARSNGIDLAFESLGDSGSEAILLISGLGTQMIRWSDRFCGELVALGYRVIRFDNRDVGYSTHFSNHAPPELTKLAALLTTGGKPEVPYTLFDMAADAVGLLDALLVTRVHCVGRSMGGMIAQILASEFPDRVMSLTSIMSSSGSPDLPQAAPEVMAMLMRPGPNPFLDRSGYLANSLAFARRIAGSSPRFDEECHQLLVLEEVRRAYDPAGAARQLAAMVVAGDRRSRLSTIAAPTLVIHGLEDPLILPACGRDTAGCIPNAELLLIEGMGHHLPALHDRFIAEAIHRNAGRRQPLHGVLAN